MAKGTVSPPVTGNWVLCARTMGAAVEAVVTAAPATAAGAVVAGATVAGAVVAGTVTGGAP